MTGPSNYRTHNGSVALLPLAAVVCLHLALVSLWVLHSTVNVEPVAGQRQFVLAWLPRPTAAEQRLPPPKRIAERVARPVAAPAITLPGPTPSARTEPPPEHDQRGDMVVTLPTTPEPVSMGQLLATAKRQVGAIDRDLQGGKVEAFKQDPAQPIARLRVALEGAHIDRSRTTLTETMMQADGVVVYRFRRGNKIWCRQSGAIGSGIERSDGARLAGAGSAGGAGTAGTIPCPSGEAGWSRL